MLSEHDLSSTNEFNPRQDRSGGTKGGEDRDSVIAAHNNVKKGVVSKKGMVQAWTKLTEDK